MFVLKRQVGKKFTKYRSSAYLKLQIVVFPPKNTILTAVNSILPPKKNLACIAGFSKVKEFCWHTQVQHLKLMMRV